MSEAGLLGAACLLLLSPALLGRFRRRPESIGGILLPIWWAARIYTKLAHGLQKPTGDAPLPEHGPALLIANHTSGVDSMILFAVSRRPLGFMIIKEWYDHWIVNPFCKVLGCIPVRRDGTDLAATRAALRALADGRVVPIFPEGVIVPDSGRTFAEGKPGAAYLALRAGVPVIPAYLSGTPPTDDIIGSWFATSRSRVVFGPPIDLSPYRHAGERPDRETIEVVSKALMDAIRALKDQHPIPDDEDGDAS
jgi:1-acyl-sn-glycerol-3-phosphate acyltransferase